MPQVSLVWMPSGIAAAVLLRFGAALSPGAWLGAFAINCGTGFGAPASAVIACGNILELRLAVRLMAPSRRWRRLGDYVRLLPGVLIAPLPAATVGTVVLTVANADASSSAWRTWLI
ncbi:MAG: hypothetical protein GY711_19675 [bacterium]|nr:hypothetical protein [bacterium]